MWSYHMVLTKSSQIQKYHRLSDLSTKKIVLSKNSHSVRPIVVLG